MWSCVPFFLFFIQIYYVKRWQYKWWEWWSFATGTLTQSFCINLPSRHPTWGKANRPWEFSLTTIYQPACRPTWKTDLVICKSFCTKGCPVKLSNFSWRFVMQNVKWAKTLSWTGIIVRFTCFCLLFSCAASCSWSVLQLLLVFFFYATHLFVATEQVRLRCPWSRSWRKARGHAKAAGASKACCDTCKVSQLQKIPKSTSVVHKWLKFSKIPQTPNKVSPARAATIEAVCATCKVCW